MQFVIWPMYALFWLGSAWFVFKARLWAAALYIVLGLYLNYVSTERLKSRMFWDMHELAAGAFSEDTITEHELFQVSLTLSLMPAFVVGSLTPWLIGVLRWYWALPMLLLVYLLSRLSLIVVLPMIIRPMSISDDAADSTALGGSSNQSQ